VNASHAPAAYGEEPEEPQVEVLDIEGELSGELCLSRPVRIEVWQEGGDFIADAAEFNVHAFGTTRDEAVANLRDEIVEQRQRLLTLRDRLSPSMRRDAQLLEAAILLRHA
jgi:hypothetical protein